jgi:predicted amidohydrolase
MNIAAAQIASIRGDAPANIARHLALAELAAAQGAGMVIFPELSLTGYQPIIADEVAMLEDDPRLHPLQALADSRRITLCVGAPLVAGDKPTISLLVFQPGMTVRVYSKQYLHADEEPYFMIGDDYVRLNSPGGRIAFAICYELSVPQHAADAHAEGASIYLASVAKTHSGVIKAHTRLAEIAREYRMTVFMANCVGPCEDTVGGGQSAVWNAQGERLAVLDDSAEGLVIYDPAQPGVSARTVRWSPAPSAS